MTLKTGITRLSESQRKSFSCRKSKRPCSKDYIHSVLEIYVQHMVGIEMQLPTRDLYRTVFCLVAWTRMNCMGGNKDFWEFMPAEMLPGWTEGDINGMKWVKAVGILELWNTGWVNSAVLFWTYITFPKKGRMTHLLAHPSPKRSRVWEDCQFH